MAKKQSQAAVPARGDSVSTKGDNNKNKKKTDNKNKSNNYNNKKKKNSKTKSNGNKNDINNWITSLARDSASNDIGTAGAKIPSKEDRKRKRELKKNKRMEEKELKQLQQQQQQQSSARQSTHTLKKAPPPTNPHTSSGASSSQSQKLSQSVLLELSRNRIRRMSRNLLTLRKDIYKEKAASSGGERPRPYYLPEGFKDKLKKRKRKWNEDSIQPFKSDYSGIGVARISMYIEFMDPSYYPKLEEEFQEHIPGFFGKQRTKAMKRQMDGNMLWRRLANDKKNNNGKLSKKLKGMSADERVQAMIDSDTTLLG